MRNKRSLVVRIVAIILCALMVLGIFAGVICAFAVDVGATPAETGSSSLPIWFIVAGLIAVVAVVVCVILPKKKND